VGYVVFGHGGLDDTNQNMPACALSPGTTVQFYSDLGQALWQGPQTSFNFPAGIPQPWPAVDSTGVVPNLSLSPFSADELNDFLKLNPTWGGHTLLIVGQQIPVHEAMMCTGTPDTCPTDPAMITGRRPGPQAHGANCKGLLKRYAGQQLHWLACTAVMASGRAAARIDVPEGSRFASYLQSLRDNPEGFAQWFDRLGSEQISSELMEDLLTEPQIATWHRARMVRAALGDSPPDVQLGENPDDPIANARLSVGGLVADACDQLREDPDRFGQMFDRWPAGDQALMLKHPFVQEWNASRPNPVVLAESNGPSAVTVDWDDINEINRANLMNLVEGGAEFYMQAGGVVLIGNGHLEAHTQHVQGQPDEFSGLISLQEGRLLVEDCRDETSFAAAMQAPVTEKPIEFLR
jgi:hypothetical protein